jgi:hypothetical protein
MEEPPLENISKTDFIYSHGYDFRNTSADIICSKIREFELDQDEMTTILIKLIVYRSDEQTIEKVMDVLISQGFQFTQLFITKYTVNSDVYDNIIEKYTGKSIYEHYDVYCFSQRFSYYYWFPNDGICKKIIDYDFDFNLMSDDIKSRLFTQCFTDKQLEILKLIMPGLRLDFVDYVTLHCLIKNKRTAVLELLLAYDAPFDNYNRYLKAKVDADYHACLTNMGFDPELICYSIISSSKN